MKEGDIALTQIHQDPSGKIRHVLLFRKMPPFNDFLVCAISTQLQQYVKDFDLLPDSTAPGFSKIVLHKSSVVKSGSLPIISSKNIAGVNGSISNENLPLLKSNLAFNLMEKKQ